MPASSAEIVSSLKEQIQLLQGIKPFCDEDEMANPYGNKVLNKCFPLGAIHEFHCGGSEDFASTVGFTAGMIASLMKGGKYVLWISKSGDIFPPALATFGMAPGTDNLCPP